ncbi:hypothetical protein [Pedobacter sp. V48]|uniref:hypothetical protein n=1 Tax=Pedobacter sp. V48 TaxID=509635 RepID=UPI0003E56EF5|nr:hypothetical protein [Pedobacter sp. V48]ETZ20139.1 hypothetical protein N824_07965 [Pedobacter sp. V48]
MTVSEYQLLLQSEFEHRFELETKNEWSSKMKHGLYAPRLDIALGPFAIEDGNQKTEEHLDLFNGHKSFFEQLTEIHLENLQIITSQTLPEYRNDLVSRKLHDLEHTNYNGRCFIAIEIENNVSRKHLMGGAINASTLGKVGIAIGFNETKHRAFLNLYRYFEFLYDVGKPTFNTSNLLIISKDQLLDCLMAY